MEVVVTEEKKKIFRAKKTMKMSDRLQLESLHSTLLTTAPRLSNPSPPPLVNGTHKEDGQKGAEKEQNNTPDRSSPHAASPSTPTPTSSPAPFLSLNLSPSTASSQSPNDQEEVASPTSPFHSEFPDLNKTKEVEKKSSSPSQSKESVTTVSIKINAIPVEGKEEKKTTTDKPAENSGKNVVLRSSVQSAASKCVEPMDTESDTINTNDSVASTSAVKDEKPSSPVVATSNSSTSPASGKDLKQTEEIKKDDIKDEDDKPSVEAGLKREEKMEVCQIKSEVKKKKKENGVTTKTSRPSSTPPSNADKEKSSSSGLKRTLSEGNESDEQTVKKEGKRPKVEHVELKAQLEVKIPTKAGSKHKLEKIIQQIVTERLKILEQTIFDKHFQELKDRVDKIDCANKHQTAITALQSKISRLAKKFGEANQASENKKKEEALAAAAAATAAAAAAAATAAKPTTVTSNAQAQRPIQTSTEVKQTPTVSSSSTTTVTPLMKTEVKRRNMSVVPLPVSLPTSAAASVPVPAPVSTTATMVPQTSILQLITSSANAASSLAAGITTQSQPGTLLLKTTPGTSMMTAGQPLVIQLPLSMNGQTGTLVNFPMSSLSAATTLTKSKTTPTTTTFIIKSPPSTNAASVPTSTVATLPAIQAPSGQVSTTQISLARPVYQGGAGRITTPNAGVSVATVRAPAQSVSVAGALSSASSPATSVPAATGSTAPGTPQGTSLTSKTDNQVSAVSASGSGSSGITTGITAPKATVPAPRPKGSVIDLTEDDDDVQVTGVKNATIPTTSSAPRPNPVMSIPSKSTSGARSSPKNSQNSSSNPQITVHHRPPQDSPLKPRTVTTSASSRGSNTSLPPLPPAPAAPRLPPEAEQTSPPQQLQLKLVPGQTGIVLSWSVAEVDRTCAAVDSYHLYAFHQDNSNGNATQQHWKKIGEVNALPLPMACTLTQFQSGSTYYFAVRAKDIYGRFGTFCEPQCTNVISSSSS